MRLLSFGTYNIQIPQETDVSVPGRSALAPLSIGAFDQDGTRFYPQAKTFSHRMLFVETAEQTINELQAAFFSEAAKGLRVVRADNRQGERWQTFAKVTDASRTEDGSTAGGQALDIEFEMAHPYWYLSSQEPSYLDDGHTLADGLGLSDGNREAFVFSPPIPIPVNWTIDYGGDVVLRKSKLYFVPRAGVTVGGIQVWNKTTMEIIDYSGSVTNPDFLVFDLTSPYKVSINGGVGTYDLLTKSNTQPTWLTLKPGENIVQLDADTITGASDVYWYNSEARIQ